MSYVRWPRLINYNEIRHLLVDFYQRNTIRAKNHAQHSRKAFPRAVRVNPRSYVAEKETRQPDRNRTISNFHACSSTDIPIHRYPRLQDYSAFSAALRMQWAPLFSASLANLIALENNVESYSSYWYRCLDRMPDQLVLLWYFLRFASCPMQTRMLYLFLRDVCHILCQMYCWINERYVPITSPNYTYAVWGRCFTSVIFFYASLPFHHAIVPLVFISQFVLFCSWLVLTKKLSIFAKLSMANLSTPGRCFSF